MAETRVTGQDVRLLVDDGQYVQMLGQTEASINESGGTIDGRDVDSGYASDLVEGGDLDGNVSLNGQMVQGDLAYAALYKAFKGRYKIKVILLTKWRNGVVEGEGGMVMVTACNRSGGRTDTRKYAITLNMAGDWEPVSLS